MDWSDALIAETERGRRREKRLAIVRLSAFAALWLGFELRTFIDDPAIRTVVERCGYFCTFLALVTLIAARVFRRRALARQRELIGMSPRTG